MSGQGQGDGGVDVLLDNDHNNPCFRSLNNLSIAALELEDSF